MTVNLFFPVHLMYYIHQSFTRYIALKLERSVFLKNVEKPFLIIFIPFEKIYPGNI